ncbi:MAG: hypothetical protein KDA53_03290 [Hyphomonas sp.]|nr:hypothetical protein [Hyphomonas sp.]
MLKPVLFALVGTGLIAACGAEMTPDEHRAYIERLWPRPADVPESAILHAGEDGGHWSDCRFTGERLDCDIYHVRGGLYYRRAFKLCVAGNPGSLAGGVNGIGETGYPTGWENVVLVPLEAAQYPDDRAHLQDEADREFEEAGPPECPVELVPRPQRVL